MNRFYYSLILSVLIHAVIITAVYLTLSSAMINKSSHKIIIPIEIEHQQQLQYPEHKIVKHSKSHNIKSLSGKTDLIKKELSLMRKREFHNALINRSQKNKTLPQAPADLHNVSIKTIPDFSYNPQSKYVNPADDIAKDIMRFNNNGTMSGVSVSGIVSTLIKFIKHKNNKLQFDFIPTKNQIMALKILFKKESATQLGLYKSLDFNSPVTAESFNEELSQLVDKGFLKRKKISPQLIINMFGVPVEMSSKNIKNPIYKYESLISRSQIITFLQSQLFLLEEKLARSSKDIPAVKQKIAKINKEIQILVQ